MNLSNNELNCLERLYLMKATTRNIYTKDYFQFSDNGEVFFKDIMNYYKTELECGNLSI